MNKKKIIELHIFDFDGTLFNSPTPSLAHAEYVSPGSGDFLHKKLLDPVWSGGYGWFQNLHTLTPPAVPQKPEISEWFVTPVLDYLKKLIHEDQEVRGGKVSEMEKSEEGEGRDPHHVGCEGSEESVTHFSSSLSENIFPSRLYFVLTGRDQKFTSRIRELLDHAGVLSFLERVMLKPHESYGTVKFKLETFGDLVQIYSPSRVWYYEDRLEQGGKLMEGVRCLQKKLSAEGLIGVGNDHHHKNNNSPWTMSRSPEGCSSVTDGVACSTHPETIRSTTRAFPFAPLSKGMNANLKEIPFLSFFHSSEKKAQQATRFGERWAEDYLKRRGFKNRISPSSAYHRNSKNNDDGGVAHHSAMTASAGDIGAFDFFMVLVEPSLSSVGEKILSTDAFSKLVDTLYQLRAGVR